MAQLLTQRAGRLFFGKSRESEMRGTTYLLKGAFVIVVINIVIFLLKSYMLLLTSAIERLLPGTLVLVEPFVYTQ